MTEMIVGGEDRKRLIASLVGGKAVNLGKLCQLGAPVPEWYVLTTEAFRATTVTITEEITAELTALTKRHVGNHSAQVETVSRRIKDRILGLAMPEMLVEALLSEHPKCIGEHRLFSVRSSAVDEDTGGASFAGLHDSFLFVRGFDALLDNIRKVWASAFNSRALIFRLQNDMPLDHIAIAVVVQRMIEAERSGIVFTANPNTGNVHQILVSALYGAGEGIVSAGLDADLYTVAKTDLSYQAQLADKNERLQLDRETGSGVQRCSVPEAWRHQSTLTDTELRALAELSLIIERSFGKPQDIEFSLDANGKIWILQTRPITTVVEYGPAAGNQLIWDNSNIIESYAGVTSPLTFSFIRRAYAAVYRGFAEIMGVDSLTVRRHEHVFENMLGFFHGRVYYNLMNWYRVISLFPGYRYNKVFLEAMLGLKESPPYEPSPDSHPCIYRKLLEPLRLLRVALRTLYNFKRLEKLVREFGANFEFHFSRWQQIDFRRLQPHELMGLYIDMEQSLLIHWKTPTINDFFVMIYYGLLKKLCLNWCEDVTGTLQNDLICGEGNILSTAPIRMTMEIAAMIAANSEWQRLFEMSSPAELANRVPCESDLLALWEKIEEYLNAFGYRRMNELKLEEPTLIENPEFLYQTLKNYLAMNMVLAGDDAIEKREQSLRRKAEAKVFSILGKGLRAVVFRRVLRNARLGVRNRENLRLYRTRIYGLLRELVIAVGERFEQEGILRDHGEIFYLTLDEVWDFIKGTAVTVNLQALTDLRMEEFERWRAETDTIPDDRFETFGMAYYRNSYRNPTPVPQVEGGLHGIGCCPGQVTAKIRVLSSPKDNLSLNGEILVTRSTDPGWVPLFPAVSGILIEHGSILSHSAIVAREMGIPTIVGINGLFDTLQDGQTVKMDGSTGMVTIVDS